MASPPATGRDAPAAPAPLPATPPVQRIYAVSAGSYSDYRVLCVCPTKKDAQKVARKVRGAAESWHRDADVEEFLMVTGDVEQVPVLRLTTTLWDDGAETAYDESVSDEWHFDSIHDVVPMSWRWVRAPCHENKGGRLDLLGTDAALVRKTFSDKRAEIIADDALRMKREAKGRVLR